MYKQLKEISNYAKYLSATQVKTANSGHTGAAVGMADFLTVLYTKHLNFDISSPNAINRDRFVMSNGHASALLYSLLHLSGFKDISLDDLKNFRQLNSKTAGHPEIEMLDGVDISTGPLGQGLATSVGLAIAEKKLSTKNNTSYNHTFVTVGDGCLSEGLSHEALELAGHLKLNKLIVMFDDNKITIDGKTSLFTSTNIKKRMQAYGFDVLECDGHNLKKIDKTLSKAKKSKTKPVFIMFKTVIGKDTIKEDTSAIHGYPLKENELKEFKESLGLSVGEFIVPAKIYHMVKDFHDKKEFKALNADDLFIDSSKEVHNALDELKKMAIEDNVSQATRASIGECIDITSRIDNDFISGSADLTPSNCTKSKSMKSITPDNANANYIHYGIKEHAMGAIANGLSAYANKSYTAAVGTFLSFSDFVKPSIRMSALMNLPIQYIFTHDSIGVGEDGPTHQPIEQFVSLRATPNSYTFRPCDMVETVEGWQTALKIKQSPSFHLLSRQSLPLLRNEFSKTNKVASGGYIIYEDTDKITSKVDGLFVATGSEVSIAVEAAKKLTSDGFNVKVVSMPCYGLFVEQTEQYRESILPKEVRNRVVIEAGSTFGLANIAGLDGKFLGIDEFGKSANAKELFNYFNLTSEFAYNEMKNML